MFAPLAPSCSVLLQAGSLCKARFWPLWAVSEPQSPSESIVGSRQEPLTPRLACRADELWIPNTERPEWLDGTLPGDRGFDPLGLAKPGDFLQVLNGQDSRTMHCMCHLVLGQMASGLRCRVQGQYLKGRGMAQPSHHA